MHGGCHRHLHFAVSDSDFPPGIHERGKSDLLFWVSVKFGQRGRQLKIGHEFGPGLLRNANGYTVVANDLFTPLVVFWQQLKADPEKLALAVKSLMPVSKQDFHNYRSSIQEQKDHMTIAAYYFVLNRTSFSGATLSGGFSQEAANKRLTLSCIDRLKRCQMENVSIDNVDGCEFLATHPPRHDTVIYADPPYYIKSCLYGKGGDLHAEFSHEALARHLLARHDWILSYNDCEFIRQLYKGCRILPASWSYGMNATKASSEIIILPQES
jgi:DNA adenine methylase